MARITPDDMIADLDKKIAWFDANPPRDAKTGNVILDPRFIAQVDMLRAMRQYIAECGRIIIRVVDAVQTADDLVKIRLAPPVEWDEVREHFIKSFPLYPTNTKESPL